MAASVLSLSEQKLSLSAKKKKKKTVKNILGLPSNLTVKSLVLDQDKVQKLSRFLERLLPVARIPVQKKKVDHADNDKKVLEDSEEVKEAKIKRKQLALGVNDLNRSIKRNSVAAAVLSSDIYPKFLIHHINLLCSYNKIPFIHMPGLREITQKTLGFPCIALGFKKDFDDFREAVNEIQILSKSESFESEMNTSESASSDDEEEMDEIKVNNDKREIDNTESVKNVESKPFVYLYRSSNKERVFIPENYYNEEMTPRKTESEYIPLGEHNESDMEKSENIFSKKVSDNVLIKARLNLKKKIRAKKTSSYEANDEDYEVPKKKTKVGWTTDKIGNKKNFKYSPANIIKFQSPENRMSKKNI